MDLASVGSHLEAAGKDFPPPALLCSLFVAFDLFLSGTCLGYFTRQDYIWIITPVAIGSTCVCGVCVVFVYVCCVHISVCACVCCVECISLCYLYVYVCVACTSPCYL